MAKINIYGTLHNDTGEPIAAAEQIYDTREGKEQRCLTDILDSLEEGGGVEIMTDEEISAIISEVEAEAASGNAD